MVPFNKFDRKIIQKMWPSGFLSDVILKVQDKEYNIHRAVLEISRRFALEKRCRMIIIPHPDEFWIQASCTREEVSGR